MLATRLLRPKR